MKAVVSGEVSREILLSLSSVAEVFLLLPDDALALPVRSHADMILSLIDNKAFIPQSYAAKNPSLVSFLECAGLEPVYCHGSRSAEYPSDVGLNCAVGERFIVTRTKSTDGAILCYVRETGYGIIDVKQGYAGCSTIVTDGGFITSDSGIYSALSGAGRECVLVPSDGIRLPGYNGGFIGGCGGYADGSLYFFGNIDLHPCGKPIRSFAAQMGYNIVCLSTAPLTDYGGIKFI